LIRHDNLNIGQNQTRTDTGRLLEISNRYLDENNGLISQAVKVSSNQVAEHVERFGIKPRLKGI